MLVFFFLLIIRWFSGNICRSNLKQSPPPSLPLFRTCLYLLMSFLHVFQKGSATTDPQFVVDDPDIGDTHSYVFSPSADSVLFELDAASGIVTLAQELDVDGGLNPTVYTAQVKCVDSRGLTGMFSTAFFY